MRPGIFLQKAWEISSQPKTRNIRTAFTKLNSCSHTAIFLYFHLIPTVFLLFSCYITVFLLYTYCIPAFFLLNFCISTLYLLYSCFFPAITATFLDNSCNSYSIPAFVLKYSFPDFSLREILPCIFGYHYACSIYSVLDFLKFCEWYNLLLHAVLVYR